MPKTKQSEAGLLDWVLELPFQQQVQLFTALRGADNSPKHCSAKPIIRFYRSCILLPAGNWSYQNDNDFMWGNFSVFEHYLSEFIDDIDGYPHHFVMHFIHGIEIVAYKYYNDSIRDKWMHCYKKICKHLHLNVETLEELDKRLNDFGQGFNNL
jgi:hypothetical protein